MRGGGRHELFMPLQPEQADPGFPCYHCNKWRLAQPRSGQRTSPESTKMPSGEGKPPCLRCARHSQVDFQVKPYAKWTRETQSFVTQMYLTINYSSWKKTGCFGKFVQLGTFSESAVSSFQFLITIMCSVLPVCLKIVCILFAFKVT